MYHLILSRLSTLFDFEHLDQCEKISIIPLSCFTYYFSQMLVTIISTYKNSLFFFIFQNLVIQLIFLIFQMSYLSLDTTFFASSILCRKSSVRSRPLTLIIIIYLYYKNTFTVIRCLQKDFITFLVV